MTVPPAAAAGGAALKATHPLPPSCEIRRRPCRSIRIPHSGNSQRSPRKRRPRRPSRPPKAEALIDAYTEALAQGIGAIVNILRPQAVLLGGGVSAQGEALLRPVREKLENCCFGSAVLPIPELACASLGNDAGVLGAAALAEGPWKKFYIG